MTAFAMDAGFSRELWSTSSDYGLLWERVLLVPSKSPKKKARAAVSGIVIITGTVAGFDDVGRGLYAAAIFWFLFVLKSVSRGFRGKDRRRGLLNQNKLFV